MLFPSIGICFYQNVNTVKTLPEVLPRDCFNQNFNTMKMLPEV